MLRNLFRSLRHTGRGVAPARPDAPASPEPFVAFVTTTNEVQPYAPGNAGYSSLASVRLRVLAPASSIAAGIRVLFVPLGTFIADPALSALGEPRAIVLGKLSTAFLVEHRTDIAALLRRLDERTRGPALFADLSDDYAAMGAILGEPLLAEYQAALGRHCALTVPCRALAERLLPQASKGIHVIEDPWESPRAGAPRPPRTDPARLCWFGNLGDTNLSCVSDSLAAIAAGLRGSRVELAFVAGADRARLVEEIGMRLRRENPQLEFTFIPWSLELTWRAIDDCDIVLLPQDAASPWGKVKSHNRLVEAIRGGRIAVASPVPAYQELADFAWVGETLADGVCWALAHPDAAAARVAAGQQYIATRFSPDAVGRRWREVLGIDGMPSGVALQPAAGPVRLNLGCGDKILPGYVNVDVAASRRGHRPDVLCDIRNLTAFPDASADEVMAIHVVEHFWRWEVLDILKEWFRVLKPRGQMVLECPNLLTACAELLHNPAAASGAGVEGQRTMWVLYGDPAWKDPLMCHRWNYTPESLGALMQEAGLVNVRQEPARFKLRDPRDMRIVGEKPSA